VSFESEFSETLLVALPCLWSCIFRFAASRISGESGKAARFLSFVDFARASSDSRSVQFLTTPPCAQIAMPLTHNGIASPEGQGGVFST
jgi:hypothetical protein